MHKFEINFEKVFVAREKQTNKNKQKTKKNKQTNKQTKKKKTT